MRFLSKKMVFLKTHFARGMGRAAGRRPPGMPGIVPVPILVLKTKSPNALVAVFRLVRVNK
jgi:hypothetical protein